MWLEDVVCVHGDMDIVTLAWNSNNLLFLWNHFEQDTGAHLIDI